MRFIVLRSLQEYPLQQIETAAAASARQLRLVASGRGTHDQIWHTYGIIERYIPGEVPAMHNAMAFSSRMLWPEVFTPARRECQASRTAAMILEPYATTERDDRRTWSATARCSSTMAAVSSRTDSKSIRCRYRRSCS